VCRDHRARLEPRQQAQPERLPDHDARVAGRTPGHELKVPGGVRRLVLHGTGFAEQGSQIGIA
jgi:hypothetical protein